MEPESEDDKTSEDLERRIKEMRDKMNMLGANLPSNTPRSEVSMQ